MRIVLSGGGTAGHINPALALAESLIEQGHEVFYAGTPQGVEARLVKEANLPFTPFEAKGFNRNHPKTIFSAVRIIIKSTKLACAWFEEIKPDVVVAFGGYVCIPVGRAAKKMGVPLVVHEQNSVMGMANKYLAKTARAVALTYEVAGAPVADKEKLVVTGNPVRSSVLTSTREEGRSMLGIPEEASMLLVFGGSLGARHLNAAISSMKKDLLAIDNLYVVHITGPKELETVEAVLALTEEEKKRYLVMGYQNRMGETMAACDMVVSRAGATSLAEISARCIPAILVPFPFATADHQTTNARSYVQAGAAWMMADDMVEAPEFKELVLTFVDDEKARLKMSEAARGFETGNAASKLADVVLNAAR
ncbi:uDP-N-acetylglucosamine--N-acetylmuramyl-(pentapeptide) pyrophosphoryl-undecaprenol N-acetylglucosamine transferase [Eggerthella sp. CAG:368]|nr:uDP-N-acetylglucosamine--N-acetylmuramyl-(pentapeptide) pyrophosphoryl-undecaprenol N-acetylglucosamine transferase [Eggerthella sp. CAG:368]